MKNPILVACRAWAFRSFHPATRNARRDRRLRPRSRCNLRARVYVHNADGTLAADSGWGPWSLGTTNLGRILQGVFSYKARNAQEVQVLTNRAGTEHTCGLRRTTAPFWTISGSGTEKFVRISYGNGSGTPARADYETSGVLDIADIIGRVTDEDSGTIDLSVAWLYSGAGTTITRVGLYTGGFNTSGVDTGFILMDHSAISDTPVSNGQTVTVAYRVTY